MTDTPGGRPSEPDYTVPIPGVPQHPDEAQARQFSVPVPTEATQALPPHSQPPHSQPPHSQPPQPPPAPPAARQTAGPGPWGAAPHAQVTYAAAPAERHTTGFVDAGTDALRTTGHVLLGVTLGWWLFLGVRLAWWVVQRGVSDTMLIEVIDYVPEETVAAAIVAVLAAGVLVGARVHDRLRRGTTTAIVALVVALLTIVITVWRFV